MPDFHAAVYRVVRDIPSGRVMTYGQIATILGAPRAARAVGYAMRASKDNDVPWQRVINSRGEISGKEAGERPILQRQLLEKEGVIFNSEGACDLKQYRWEPPDPAIYQTEDAVDWSALPFR